MILLTLLFGVPGVLILMTRRTATSFPWAISLLVIAVLCLIVATLGV